MATILIVEEDDDIRGVLKTLLRDKYIVLEAKDGNEGLRLANTFYVDLIITDLALPGITGIELITKLHKLNSRVKIIVITAFSTSKETEESLRQLGALDIVHKPIKLDDLSDRIAKLILPSQN